MELEMQISVSLSQQKVSSTLLAMELEMQTPSLVQTNELFFFSSKSVEGLVELKRVGGYTKGHRFASINETSRLVMEDFGGDYFAILADESS
jgi:hypothetical protein